MCIQMTVLPCLRLCPLFCCFLIFIFVLYLISFFARGSLALITLDRPFPSLRFQCALVWMNQKNAEKCYAVLDENASSREPKNCMISEFKHELCGLCSKCLTTHLLSFFLGFLFATD